MNTAQARARAETLFKRKEEQQTEAIKAREEYEARQRAISENTARLRALRLAREQRKKSVASQWPFRYLMLRHVRETDADPNILRAEPLMLWLAHLPKRLADPASSFPRTGICGRIVMPWDSSSSATPVLSGGKNGYPWAWPFRERCSVRLNGASLTIDPICVYWRKVPSPPQSLPNLPPTLRQATSARCILGCGTLEAAYRRLSWVSEADDTRRTQAAGQYTVRRNHLRLR